MSGFSIDWLDLREAADYRARNKELLSQLQQWLQNRAIDHAQLTVMDMGAGTGSTLRAFANTAAFDDMPLAWRLVDQDTNLLAEATRRHAESHNLKTYALDLTQVEQLPIEDVQLITASALFDLVSATFIDQLVVMLQAQQTHQPVALYAALNYDGQTQWSPAHPLDAAVLAAFNRDQQTDKGFGPALGPQAIATLQQQFFAAGFQVVTANSAWQLRGDERALVLELINGIANAVANDPAIDLAALKAWQEFRQQQIEEGSCIVGHMDLLILPS